MRSASVCERTFVGGDEVDGRGRRALQHLSIISVFGIRPAGTRLAAGLALLAHLGLALSLDLGFVFDLDVGIRRLALRLGRLHRTVVRDPRLRHTPDGLAP